MNRRHQTVLLLTTLGALEATQAVSYNGSIEYFIADIATTFPCHPLYDRAYTWIDTSINDELDKILEGIIEAGFNGIRLPMWPEDGRVLGPDPTNEARDISREFCDSLSIDWWQRIKTALEDSPYYGLYIYYSPAYDNKAYQDHLSEEEYANWVLSYADYDKYGANFISPFSSNDSSLRVAPIPSSSFMSDQETMWELDVLQRLKSSGGWGSLTKKP